MIPFRQFHRLALIVILGTFFPAVVQAETSEKTEKCQAVYAQDVPSGAVHFDWDLEAPSPEVCSDHFTAKLTEVERADGGDYFVQTYTSDAAKVTIDGHVNPLIEIRKESGQNIGRSLLVDLPAGEHAVTTVFEEETGNAAVFTDVVQFGNWLAYYYSGETPGGDPLAVQTIPTETAGTLDDVTPSEANSAHYVTAVHLQEGTYIVQVEGAGKFTVFVDGKALNLSEEGRAEISIAAENGTDVHWLEITQIGAAANNRLQVTFERQEEESQKTTAEKNLVNESTNSSSEAAEVEEAATPSGEDSGMISQTEQNKNSEIQSLQASTEARSLVAFSANDYPRAPGGWLARFYSNIHFSGTPVVLKDLAAIDFSWKRESPYEGVPADYFSATFEKEIYFEGGPYLFQIFANDGVQVAIDGKVVINYWGNSGPATFTETLHLSPGKHQVKIKFYEGIGLAGLSFSYAPLAKGDRWIGLAYPSENFTGAPVVIGDERIIEQLRFHWKYGSPEGIPSDHFSEVFWRDFSLASGQYIMRLWANDGVRVYVDGRLVLNEWGASGPNYFEKMIQLRSGTHRFQIEHYEGVGKSRLAFDLVQSYPRTGWNAVAFPSENFSGEPVPINGGLISEIDFQWGNGSPAPGIPTDHFSTRFQRVISVADTGLYEFNVHANDGVRIYIDGELVLDRWGASGPNNYRFARYLEKGTHKIKVEQYEGLGLSALSFSWHPVHFSNGWYGIAYPNPNFSGTPVVIGNGEPFSALRFDWNEGAPAAGIPTDYFSTRFIRQITVSQDGLYTLDLHANDGARVYIDGKLILDRWSASGPENYRKVVFLEKGQHMVKVEHYEGVGVAALSFDWRPLTPTDGWYGVAYPNPDFTGTPVVLHDGQPVERLSFNWGEQSPAANISSDYFSTRFIRQVTVAESGLYEFNINANDGIRLYIDGQLVFDRWNASGPNAYNKVLYLEKGTHTLKVEHREGTGVSGLQVDWLPLDPVEGWYGLVFPNPDFTGNPVLFQHGQPVSTVDFQWGEGSPAEGIPADGFSTRFVRKMSLKTGSYRLEVQANDGVRVYMDGKLVLDRWGASGPNQFETIISVDAGFHTFTIENYEGVGIAGLKFQISGHRYIYVDYPYSLEYAVDQQMKLCSTTCPQTDQYEAYIRSDAFTFGNIANPPASGEIEGTNWNVRTGPGTDYWVIGQLDDGAVVSIYDSVLAEDGWYWYEIGYRPKTWVNANREDVRYYLNPNNFERGTAAFFQFLNLSESANLDPAEVNEKILFDKGILEGRAEAFIRAGDQYNINEIYLIAHALLETGNGTSELARGVYVKMVDGQLRIVDSNTKGARKVYNMYGVGAYDGCALYCGAKHAYEQGWFSPEAAIIGGARFVSVNYIQAGQNTLYEMRFNPANPGTHQYATDIAWAVKQTYRIKNLYDLLDHYVLTFEIPRYR